MKSRRGTRGAVSVFLTIILVPCIVATSLFVDLGRVHLSKGVAESSADLAMNSLLTNYDKDLQEFYGLAASCQNIDEFYDVSEDYFKRMLKSQPLTEEEKQTIVDSVLGIVKGEDVSDLLQLSSLTDSNMITPVENGSLANADILKDQIVEFMKYRAPINLVENALLSGLKENADNILNTDSDNTLIDSQQKYFEDLNKTLEKAYDLWKVIEGEDGYNDKGITKSKLNDEVMPFLRDSKDTYKEIHEALIKNLLGTQGLEVIERLEIDIKEYEDDTYSNTKKASLNDIIDAWEKTAKKYDTYIEKKGELKSYFTQNPYQEGTMNPIRYWQRCHDDGLPKKIKNFKTAAEDMLEEYCKLENAWAFRADDVDVNQMVEVTIKSQDYEDINMSLQDAYDTLDQMVSDEYDACIKKGRSKPTNDSVDKSLYKLVTICASCKDKINPDTYQLSSGKTITKAVNEISSKTEEYHRQLKEAVEDLKKAKDLANDLWNLIEKTKGSFTTWESNVNGSSTPVADDSREQVEEEKGSGIQKITKEQITVFTNRIDKIIALLEPVRDYMNDTRYGSGGIVNNGKKIKDIKSYKDVENACGVKARDLPLDEASLQSKANETFRFVYGKDTEHNEITELPSLNIDSSDNTSLNNDPALNVNSPELYNWLINQDFKNAKENSQEEQKYEDEQDKANKASDEATKKFEVSVTGIQDTYSGQKEEFPSQFSAPSVGLTDLLGNLVSLVGRLITGDFSDALAGMRDSLYVTEYIFGNFSHYTYESQAKYQMLVDEQGYDVLKNRSYKEVQDLYNQQKYNKAWASTEPTDQYNKSLTNRMINSENNLSYGGEIEYILAGGNAKDSINSIYGQIFAFRLLMNTPSAFLTFWSGTINDKDAADNNNFWSLSTKASAIYTLAIGVSGATAGIVPEPLARGVLILAEATLETVRDMNYLKAGLPVKLIKGRADENWGDSRTTNPKNGLYLQYSDYLYIMTLIGMINDGDTAEAICLRVGDVIQANMRKVLPNNGLVVKEGSEESDGSTGYQLSKSIVYFKFNADLRVKPLMLELPFALQYDNNPKDSTGWCTFHTSIIRGYS